MRELKSIALPQWAAAQGFTAVNPTVQTNKNGYPFITFLKKGADGKNIAENVYFSKGSADTAIGMGTISKEVRAELLVCEVANEAGEARLKLAFPGESSYEAI